MSDIDLQVLHTQVFKMASRGHGDQTEHQLRVVEQCQHGIQRTRRPELFFHGILGHVRDSSGEPLDSWREANRISNYWKRYFQILEVPYDQSGTWYHDHGDWYEPANDITDDHEPDHPDEDAMSTAAQPGSTTPLYRFRSISWPQFSIISWCRMKKAMLRSLKGFVTQMLPHRRGCGTRRSSRTCAPICRSLPMNSQEPHPGQSMEKNLASRTMISRTISAEGLSDVSQPLSD